MKDPSFQFTTFASHLCMEVGFPNTPLYILPTENGCNYYNSVLAFEDYPIIQALRNVNKSQKHRTRKHPSASLPH